MAEASTARGRAGRTLGLPSRYAAVRRIARGGMSTLWRAEDTVLGRPVAIKLLSGALGDDPDARRRFEREGRAAAGLSTHPHVVTIFDVGETDDGHRQPYIVMEYLEGGTVAAAMKAGRVARDRVLRWLSETAAALDFAHAHGVVHRDVKPANLLLNERDGVAVADFGLARISTEATITASGQLWGTAAYLSPEQARGEPATAASDRYALAVVAYELLTGRRPFTGEGFAAQAHGHLEGTAPAASTIDPRLPRPLDAVLARGLAKAPAARWESGAAFAAALTRACAPAPTQPVPPPATVRLRPLRLTPPPRRYDPRRVAAAGALLAGIVVATAIVLSSVGGDRSGPTRAARAPAAPHRGTPLTASSGRSPATATATAATSRLAAPAPGAAPVSDVAPVSADALEAQGHAQLSGGSPAGAIPVLRRAVAAAGPGSLTYAYALFDLGRALRLAGQPAAAIPVLERRLLIPNQTAVVGAELALAQQAAGQTGPAPGAGKRRGAGGSGD